MITDIRTVVWKEWREFFSQRGNVVGLLLSISILGVLLPLQVGRGWVELPLVGPGVALWFPSVLVTSLIADAFAGERERHTLATLLASRLSDRAILLGKVGAAVGYASGLTLVSLLLGLVTVNLAYANGVLLLYSPVVALGIVVLTVLGTGFWAGVEILVALRAPTVQQAVQSSALATAVLPIAVLLGIQVLPDVWTARLAQTVVTLDMNQLLLPVVLGLAGIDCGLFALAMSRFRRERLLLSD